MKLWHLIGVLVFALALALIPSSCGDTTDGGEFASNVPFTPIPTQPPVPVQCGDGELDPDQGEECDPPEVSACAADEACVCCLCLAEGEGVGDRTFTIARPASVFLSSALGGANVSFDPWSEGPIVIRAGRPDPNFPPEPELPPDAKCSAPLELAEDALFGFNDPLGATLCTKLFAEGSSGYLDCDGGTAQDVNVVIDSMGTGEEGELMITEGLGDPELAGAGAATFRIARLVTIRAPAPGMPPMPRNAADFCDDLDYDDPLNPDQLAQYNIDPADVIVTPITFTTRRTRGEVLNSSQGQPVVIPNVEGENFLCSTFKQTDAEGALAGNVPGLDNPLLAGGDTMNAFQLFDAN